MLKNVPALELALVEAIRDADSGEIAICNANFPIGQSQAKCRIIETSVSITRLLKSIGAIRRVTQVPERRSFVLATNRHDPLKTTTSEFHLKIALQDLFGPLQVQEILKLPPAPFIERVNGAKLIFRTQDTRYNSVIINVSDERLGPPASMPPDLFSWVFNAGTTEWILVLGSAHPLAAAYPERAKRSIGGSIELLATAFASVCEYCDELPDPGIRFLPGSDPNPLLSAVQRYWKKAAASEICLESVRQLLANHPKTPIVIADDSNSAYLLYKGAFY